jgi:ketosteroid isomerase-like protein
MSVPAEVAAGMQETNDRFCREAIGQGDVSAFGEIYTQHARVLPPGAPIVEGIEAIKGFWGQAIAGMGLVEAKLTTVAVEMCGDSAVEIGHAELSLKDGVVVKGKYVVHWKQEDGGWRWDKDIWNAD